VVDAATNQFYGKPAMMMGEGGTIAFMAMLGKSFPKAQFLIAGVLGPKSNAHGPNKVLQIPYVKKLTACVAQVIAGMHSGSGADNCDCVQTRNVGDVFLGGGDSNRISRQFRSRYSGISSGRWFFAIQEHRRVSAWPPRCRLQR